MRTSEGLRANPRLVRQAIITNDLYDQRRGSLNTDPVDYNDQLDPIISCLFTTASYITRRDLGFKQPVINKWLIQMGKGIVPNGCLTMEEFNYKMLEFLAGHDSVKSPFVNDAREKLEKINAAEQKS